MSIAFAPIFFGLVRPKMIRLFENGIMRGDIFKLDFDRIDSFELAHTVVKNKPYAVLRVHLNNGFRSFGVPVRCESTLLEHLSRLGHEVKKSA